jgi:hypothetical protein
MSRRISNFENALFQILTGGRKDFDLKNLNLNWNLSRKPVIPQNPNLITIFRKQASKSRLE